MLAEYIVGDIANPNLRLLSKHFGHYVLYKVHKEQPINPIVSTFVIVFSAIKHKRSIPPRVFIGESDIHLVLSLCEIIKGGIGSHYHLVLFKGVIRNIRIPLPILFKKSKFSFHIVGRVGFEPTMYQCTGS